MIKYVWTPREGDEVKFGRVTGLDFFEGREDLVAFIMEDVKDFNREGHKVVLRTLSVSFVLAESERRFQTTSPSCQQLTEIIDSPIGDIESDIASVGTVWAS